jgi:GDP-L-fucose synthase
LNQGDNVRLTSRIYIAGGETLIGVALRERLHAAGYQNLVGIPPDEPDLTIAAQVGDFFGECRPEHVFLAAGRSGGIELNRTRPAELMLHNLLVAAHVLDAARRHKVAKLLYLASSCSYPKTASQPLRPEALFTGTLEPTNAAYATAKLAGWQLCAAFRQQYGARFITGIPTNSFGPHDDFGPDGGHVIPALIRRMHEAKMEDAAEVVIWGTGTPRREFLAARDLADACLFVMQRYDGPEPINLAGGADLSIAELARVIAQVVGYRGRLRFDTSKLDGMPRKVLDSSKLRELGWHPVADFREALAETYAWFLDHQVAGNDSDQTSRTPCPVAGAPS